MNLKNTARAVATLSTLHTAIGDHLKTARTDLEAGLKDEKTKTGTQKIGISLDDDSPDVGSVSLVQPDAKVTVTDEDQLIAWVREHAPEGSLTSRVVTEIRPSFLKVLLAEITAAGVPQWCDKETGEIHDVPGVTMQGRAAYVRVTVPDDGKAAIGQAWRDGRLANVLPGIAPAVAPAAIEPADGGEDIAKLQERIAELEKRDEWLSALEAAGVDNWQGMDHAVELYNGGAE